MRPRPFCSPQYARPMTIASACLALIVSGALASPALARDRHAESGHHRNHAKHKQYDHHQKHGDRFAHKRKSKGNNFNFQISLGNTHRGGYYKQTRYRDYGYHHKSHRCSGYYKRVWIPPRFGYRYGACGNRFRVLIRHGYYKTVWISTCSCNKPRYCR